MRRNSIRQSWATWQRSFEQIAVIAEVRRSVLEMPEHEMPVRHRIGTGREHPSFVVDISLRDSGVSVGLSHPLGCSGLRYRIRFSARTELYRRIDQDAVGNMGHGHVPHL